MEAASLNGIRVKESKLEALQHLPVNLFGSVMGLSGLSLAWRLSHTLFRTSPLIGEWIGGIAVVVFIVLAIAYLAKWFLFPDKVASEFNNPIVGNFFGTITIAVLLLSAVIGPYNKRLSEQVWFFGTLFTLVIAYIIVHRLMTHRQDILHATPAWLIPGVGTLDVPVAGSTMPFPWSREVNLMCFGIGVILALVFFTLIFSRLMHYDPMPERMTPSLMISIAPFGVGFLAYVNITGRVDMFASVLFYFGLFLFCVLFGKVFKRGRPFAVTWWAVSFPMAALSNAALKYAMYVNAWPMKLVAGFILAILTVVIAVIFVLSLIHLFQGKLLKG